MIEIIEVNTEALRKEFALIPYRLYQGNPYWVPPMLQGEINDITPEKNPYFRFCEAKFWIAQLDGKRWAASEPSSIMLISKKRRKKWDASRAANSSTTQKWWTRFSRRPKIGAKKKA